VVLHRSERARSRPSRVRQVLPRRVRTSSAALLLAAALVVSGCSNGPVSSLNRASPSPASPTPSSSVVMAVPPAPDTTSPATTVSAEPGGLGGGDAVYLETSPAAVLLVRWTERDGQLQGVFTVTGTAATAAGTTTTSTSFTGLLDHQHLTLTLNKELGSATTLTGSIRGSQLLLTVPQDDGQLVDAPFNASSVSDYNTAVAGLADQGTGLRTRQPPRQRRRRPARQRRPRTHRPARQQRLTQRRPQPRRPGRTRSSARPVTGWARRSGPSRPPTRR